MKKIIMMAFLLPVLLSVRAYNAYQNVEIGGFIYNLREVDSTEYHGDLIGMTDEAYADICRTHELVCPENVTYNGCNFEIIMVYATLFENRDFTDLESVILPLNLLAIGTNFLYNLPNLRMVTGGENVEAFLSGSLTDLPSLSEIQLSSHPWQHLRLTLVRLGVSRLIFPTDAYIDRVERSVCDLPNLIELSICGCNYITWSFCELPVLQEITFQTAPKSISSYSFKNLSSLERLTFCHWNDSKSITVYNGTFTGTPKLKDVYVEERTPCMAQFKYEEDGFYPPRMTLHVPVGSREAYASAEGWKDFGEIVDDVISGVETAEADGDGNAWSCGAIGGGVSVSARSAVEIAIVTPAGAVVKRVAVGAGETATVELHAGVYIVAAEGSSAKVCVK